MSAGPTAPGGRPAPQIDANAVLAVVAFGESGVTQPPGARGVSGT